MKLYELGLFIVICGIFGFGVSTLERADKICKAKGETEITKACIDEALQPIRHRPYHEYNS